MDLQNVTNRGTVTSVITRATSVSLPTNPSFALPFNTPAALQAPRQIRNRREVVILKTENRRLKGKLEGASLRRARAFLSRSPIPDLRPPTSSHPTLSVESMPWISRWTSPRRPGPSRARSSSSGS